MNESATTMAIEDDCHERMLRGLRLVGAISGSLLPEDVAQATMDVLKDQADTCAGAMYLTEGRGSIREASRSLRPLAHWGMEMAEVDALALDEGLVAIVCGQAQARTDPRDRFVTLPSHAVPRYWALPLGVQPIPSGILLVRFATSDPGLAALTSHETLANLAGMSLDRACLFVSLKDAYARLTSVQNRLTEGEKQAAVGRMAAELVHEIGTPLNIIRGRAEMLMSVTEREPLEQGLHTIIEQIDRISRLLRQVLEIGRKQGNTRELVALRPLLDEVADLVFFRLQQTDIDLDIQVPPDLPPVPAGIPPLQQVFINLLTNAIDAILADPDHMGAKGRGRITIVARLPEDSPYLEVRFVDNGQGIRTEHLDRLYEPFFTTKPAGDGSGLGLPVVHRILSELGGHIEVQSEWTRGTAFIVRLATRR